MEPDLTTQLIVALLAVAAGSFGSLGGFGGAVLLVPVLVLLGWSPLEAAPLGIAMSAATALAAVLRQAANGVANFRLGVTMEISASIGAAAGALASLYLAPRAVQYALAAAAISAASISFLRRGQRNLPIEGADLDQLRDQPGQLASAYVDEHGRVVPYQVVRVAPGLALMGATGGIAGLTGVSGGFLKTPILSELMHVPVKVAAATSMFMVGVTTSVALAVYASQGRVSGAIAPAVIGGLIGGRLGAAIQPQLSAPIVRRLLSIVLLLVGLFVLARA